jgi:putative spermidine/putrescine transport system permease protein
MKNRQKPSREMNTKIRPAGWQIVALALFLFYMLLPIVSTYVFSVATRWDRTILPE